MAYLSEACRYVRTTGNVNTVTFNYSAAYPAGTAVVVTVNAPVTTVWTSPTLTDSAGNTYTQVGTPLQNAANYQLATFAAILTSPVTTATTLTATVTGANPAKWMVLGEAYSGVASIGATVAATGSGSSVDTGAVASAAAAEDLAAVVAWTNSGDTTTVTPGSGWSAANARATATDRSSRMAESSATVAGQRSFTAALSTAQGWAARLVTLVRAVANQAPTLTLAATAAAVHAGGDVTVTATAGDSDGTLASYQWSVTGGGVLRKLSTDAAPSTSDTAVRLHNGGNTAERTATVTCTVTDNAGAQTTKTVQVTLRKAVWRYWNGTAWVPAVIRRLT